MTQTNMPNAGADDGAATPPQQPAASLRRRLTRSRRDRKIAGVAGGLGEYTGYDPLIFRVVLVVLALFGGSGIVLYVLLWAFVPEEDKPHSEIHSILNRPLTLRSLGVVVGFVALAVISLGVFGGFFHSAPPFYSLATICGIALIAYLVLRSDAHAARGAAGPSYPRDTAGGSADFGQTPGTAYSGVAAPMSPATASGPDEGTTPMPAYDDRGLAGEPAAAAPLRERSLLGRITASASLVAVGTLLAYRAADPGSVPFTVVPAVALVIVGLGLLAGTFWGRSRWLIALGVALTLVTSGAAVATSAGTEAVGTRNWNPQSVAEVQPTYRLAWGEALLDLTVMPPPTSGVVDAEVAVGVGSLTVYVPPEVSLDITAHAETGRLQLPDGTWDEGAGLRRHHYAVSGDDSFGTIKLDLWVGMGSLEVHRASS